MPIGELGQLTEPQPERDLAIESIVLAKLGLLERSVNPEDGRSLLVGLNP